MDIATPNTRKNIELPRADARTKREKIKIANERRDFSSNGSVVRRPHRRRKARINRQTKTNVISAKGE